MMPLPYCVFILFSLKRPKVHFVGGLLQASSQQFFQIQKDQSHVTDYEVIVSICTMSVKNLYAYLRCRFGRKRIPLFTADKGFSKIPGLDLVLL